MKHLLHTCLTLLCCGIILQASAQEIATDPAKTTGTQLKAILCGITADSSVGKTLYYTVSKSELSAMNGLCVESADQSWSINRMHMIYMPKNSYMEDMQSMSGDFKELHKTRFAAAGSGDIFVFDNLRAVNNAGSESPLNQILIYIR